MFPQLSSAESGTWTLVLIPVISALIGWGSNYIAIKMLFRPRNEIRILGFAIQGVFPKRQAQLAKKFGELVSQELLSAAELLNKISALTERKEVQDKLLPRVRTQLVERLPNELPMLAMFMSPQILDNIGQAMGRLLAPLLTEVMDVLSNNISTELNIAAVVEEKMAGLSTEKLEQVLLATLQREFRFIEILGGVVGFLIGLLQLGLLLLM